MTLVVIFLRAVNSIDSGCVELVKKRISNSVWPATKGNDFKDLYNNTPWIVRVNFTSYV